VRPIPHPTVCARLPPRLAAAAASGTEGALPPLSVPSLALVVSGKPAEVPLCLCCAEFLSPKRWEAVWSSKTRGCEVGLGVFALSSPRVPRVGRDPISKMLIFFARASHGTQMPLPISHPAGASQLFFGRPISVRGRARGGKDSELKGQKAVPEAISYAAQVRGAMQVTEQIK
jgi:hypothetical protein